MSNGRRTSVTDFHGQVHGVNGLFVADNSVLPSMGAVNSTLSTVALAIRMSDYITGRTNTDMTIGKHKI
ncbi:GMC oxidoreductase [Paenibacillus harenae]|uniref:GMC oxidoreductase n=1 Tax=Paenibacillus harenae TaxID=306543 RepID=UPI003CCBDB17